MAKSLYFSGAISKVNKFCLALTTLFNCLESFVLLSPVSYPDLFLKMLKGLRWRHKRGSFWARLLLYFPDSLQALTELEGCGNLPCAFCGVINTTSKYTAHVAIPKLVQEKKYSCHLSYSAFVFAISLTTLGYDCISKQAVITAGCYFKCILMFTLLS